MLNVTLVCNNDGGVARTVSVRPGTTIEGFLEVFFQGNVDDYTVTVRPAGGVSRTANLLDELNDGDRVVLAPLKVEGETL